MKLFRLRFILLGLLLCICHVWCSTCGREFGDAASNAYYAQIIVIGTVSQLLPPDVKNTHDSIVRVKQSRNILKGSKLLKKRLKFRRAFSITVGKFGEEDLINCVSPVKRDQQYIFFLNMTNSVEYYTQTGLPIHAKSKKDFKKSKRLISRMLCNKGDCVKAPVWDNRKKMRDKNVDIGKSIELNCKLKRSSFPSALYKWYKNDTEVQSLNISGLTIKDSKKGSRLKIKKATPADEGTYKCIAANIGGSIQQEAVIKISGVAGPQNPTREMRDKDTRYNGTLKLTCRTRSGTKPKPTFTWYKDGKEIQTGSREGLTIKTRGNESKLRKKNVVLSDQGTYKCVARNAGGDTFQTSNVKVKGGPKKEMECSEEDKHYCYNNGTCKIMVEINKKFCSCKKEYTGKRCSQLNLNFDKAKQKLAQDRHLIIVGIISGILLFIGICVLSYFLAKRRREQFYRRRRQHMNGNIEDNIPQVYRPLIGCDEIDGLKKHMNGVVIHKETQTIETCFLGNDKGSLYINPLEGYIQGNDKNSRNRKPAISIEEDPSPEPATPEDSCEFPNENSSVTPKNKNSGSNSASDGAPNERLNDLSPRRQGQGREHSKQGAINGVPNIQGSDPTKPPAFNLDTDSEDDILSDGTPLTPLHISEEEDNNDRNKTNNKHGSTSTMERVEEKNRKNSNTKECNDPKPIEPSELFPMIKKKDKPAPPPQQQQQQQQQPQNEKLYASSSASSSDGGESDSSSTTEGCDSPNTLASLHEELGSDPVLHQVMIQNNYNPEANPPGPGHGPDNKGPAPEARQPKPQGTRGPGPGPTGQRGSGPRDHGPRAHHHHHHHRDPRGPPRDHREHGPRGPGPRDPRDHRELRDPRDLRDPNHPRDPRDQRDPRVQPRDSRDPRDPRNQGFRPPPLRDPRDPRVDPGSRAGPRDPSARGPNGPRDPRDPNNRPMPPRDIGPPRDPSHKMSAPQPPAPDTRGPEPQPQQNIPPFPVFSNFYDTPPIDKDRNQCLKSVGRNQGPISL